MRMRSLAAAVLIAALPLGALAAPVQLDPPQMREAARIAVDGGRDAAALAMADALLLRDPEDVFALLIRSRALRGLGRFDAAIAAAQSAWDLADSDAQSFDAARVMAQALSSAGRRSRAQFWLRRAAEAAPNDGFRDVAIRDYRYVRARNPLQTSLTFAITPSSNVNGGSSEEEAVLFGLPFVLGGATRALSGTQVTAGAELRYRLPATRRVQDEFSVAGQTQHAVLSDAARDQAPDASNGDFTYTTLDLAWRRVFADAEARRGYNATTVTLGQGWYGGDPLSHRLRLDAERVQRIGGGAELRLGGHLQYEEFDTANSPPVLKFGLAGGTVRRIEGVGLLRLDLETAVSRSDNVALDYRSVRGSVEYRPDRPILSTELTLSASLKMQDFDASSFATGGRFDSTATLGAEMLFREIESHGFSPVLSVTGAWRSSDIDLYDSETLGLRLGLRSSF
ncbi:hypothetical protein LCGC14_1313600 [marine sediment metagenome]|uniref:DUF560 domain-containing protein n=1 Tax=marine sediment metagenome TaxID=412755 RepID=A0A0F9KM56_9ZZZZ